MSFDSSWHEIQNANSHVTLESTTKLSGTTQVRIQVYKNENKIYFHSIKLRLKLNFFATFITSMATVIARGNGDGFGICSLDLYIVALWYYSTAFETYGDFQSETTG